MTSFVPYKSGGRSSWRKREADAAGRVEDRAAEAEDVELQRVRAERQRIVDEYKKAQQADRIAIAEHEMIDLPRELSGFIQSGRAARSFRPFLLDALAAYLAAYPQFRPRTLADAVPDPMTHDELLARHHARHGLTVPVQQVPVPENVEPEKRGRGRPPKRIETTDDGALLDE